MLTHSTYTSRQQSVLFMTLKHKIVDPIGMITDIPVENRTFAGNYGRFLAILG